MERERVSVLPKPSFMAAVTAGCCSWGGQELGSAGGCVLRGERAWCPACHSPDDTLVPSLSSSALHTCTLRKRMKAGNAGGSEHGVLEVSGHGGELLPTFQGRNQKREPGWVLLSRSQVTGP